MRYQREVRRAVWSITAMKRMSMLASLAQGEGAGELHANVAKYKEESEKEDVTEVCPLAFSPLASEQPLNTTDRVKRLCIIIIKGTREKKAATMGHLVWCQHSLL